jgi:hypothetical protein
VFLRPEEVLTHMDGLEVIHELVDELRDGYFCEVAVSFVPNEPHRKDVAQCNRNEIGILADKETKASYKILESFLASYESLLGLHLVGRNYHTSARGAPSPADSLMSRHHLFKFVVATNEPHEVAALAITCHERLRHFGGYIQIAID